ncbi:MAG: methyltransferase domain-containing protein [Alphaproteobacteria bacterium]|nr:methyltransferase domain-containing protein [Alphaproteobacteria bacterium]
MRLANRLPLRLAMLAVLVTLAQASTPLALADVPKVGQPGKDVVWVPTHETLVEKMLDIAQVTSEDYVVDLGSGDGRIVIAAAQRGAKAHGIEYNPNLVALAAAQALEADMADRVTFEEADLFEADLSRATVITMFVGQRVTDRLRPRFLELEPGTRVVSNTYAIRGWPADRTVTLSGCTRWCRAHLWVVPAEVEGTWRLGDQDLALNQRFQLLNGRLGPSRITDARMEGAEITFTVDGVRYVGTVAGATMKGTRDDGASWSAVRR